MPTLQKLGIGFVLLSPLGKGFLMGKIDASTNFTIDDFRNIVSCLSPEARKTYQTLVELPATIMPKRTVSSGIDSVDHGAVAGTTLSKKLQWRSPRARHGQH